MKLLVTGAAGQLGHDVVTEAEKNNIEVIGVDVQDMDITDREKVFEVIGKIHPDAVIHCAAWTAVDAAEDEENREKVRLINAEGTRNIALACKENNAKMLYISTDYVFDGTGTTPWDPDCKSYAPLGWYGETKLRGELAVSEILSNYL